MLPCPWRKAACWPSGASGLLKALPLWTRPTPPLSRPVGGGVNVHGEPVGWYQYNGLVADEGNGAWGCSKLASTKPAGGGAARNDWAGAATMPPGLAATAR